MLICVLTSEDESAPTQALIGITHKDLAQLYEGKTVVLEPEETGLSGALEVFLALGDQEAQLERFREVAKAGGAPPELLEQFEVEGSYEDPKPETKH